jgi:hypothetical protein
LEKIHLQYDAKTMYISHCHYSSFTFTNNCM